MLLDPFHVTGLIQYPLKTVSREYWGTSGMEWIKHDYRTLFPMLVTTAIDKIPNKLLSKTMPV